jgi:hypothetical protein
MLTALTASTAAVSRATVLTEEASFGFTTTTFNLEQLVFPQFDVAGATLNSVTLTFLSTGTLDSSLQTAIETQGYIQNTQPSPATLLDINIRIEYYLDPSSGLDNSFSNVDFFDTANVYGNGGHGANSTLAADQGPYTCASPYASCTSSPDVATWTYGTTDTSLAAGGTGVDTQTVTSGLGAFEGGGTYSLYVDTQGNYTGTLPTSYIQGVQTEASGVADITYNYTPASDVPEPATFGLLGSALAGLIAVRKRFAR